MTNASTTNGSQERRAFPTLSERATPPPPRSVAVPSGPMMLTTNLRYMAGVPVNRGKRPDFDAAEELRLLGFTITTRPGMSGQIRAAHPPGWTCRSSDGGHSFYDSRGRLVVTMYKCCLSCKPILSIVLPAFADAA